MQENKWMGILVSKSILSSIINRKKTFEKVEFYEEACEKYNLKPIYFCIQDIHLSAGTVAAYFNENDIWKQVMLPLPKVIHNRTRLGKTQRKKLSSLAGQHIKIFNQHNVYGKLFISQLLKERIDFESFLPCTSTCSQSAVKKFSEKFSSFLLKPNKGTIGAGIKKVDRLSPEWWEISYRKKRKIQKENVHKSVFLSRIKKITRSHKYLIQETIDLATYGGAPFDIRISVQKGEGGEWKITGMVAKVARKGHFLSNVARGGTCYTLEHIFLNLPELDLDKVREQLEAVALSFVQYLEKYVPHLADVGFDFGINKVGHPYFIEMNLRDQRYSFAKGKMMETWKRTYENPVAYASYLLNDKAKGWE